MAAKNVTTNTVTAPAITAVINKTFESMEFLLKFLVLNDEVAPRL